MMEIQIMSVMDNGVNGHFTVRLRVVETDDKSGEEKFGPEHVEGIEAEALRRLYGEIELDAAIDQWLEATKSTMLARYVHHAKTSTTLAGLVGKRLQVKSRQP